MHIGYVLEDLGGRTRISVECGCDIKGFFMKLMSPLFKLFAGMQQRSFFKSLKKHVEAVRIDLVPHREPAHGRTYWWP